jgi:RNA polymerase sigma-70 factor, ECF subfamily
MTSLAPPAAMSSCSEELKDVLENADHDIAVDVGFRRSPVVTVHLGVEGDHGVRDLARGRAEAQRRFPPALTSALGRFRITHRHRAGRRRAARRGNAQRFGDELCGGLRIDPRSAVRYASPCWTAISAVATGAVFGVALIERNEVAVTRWLPCLFPASQPWKLETEGWPTVNRLISQDAVFVRPTDLALMPDVALMQRVQAGARPQFAELYRRFAPRAFRAAWFVCHDRDCAQDAVQDAFISVWSSRATYQPARGSVEQWVMAIVRHRAVYLAQRLAHRRSVSETVIEEAAHLEEQLGPDDASTDLVARTDAEQLARLMGRLPTAQREVIRLGFFDGLTHQQIALRLGIPPGTVKGRMRLGLAKLRSGFSA